MRPCPTCGGSIQALNRVAAYAKIESGTRTWAELFTEVCEFLTKVGPDRVISVSHSEDQNTGVVVVWYWTDPD